MSNYQVTSAHITDQEPTLFLEKYRVRLLDSSLIPVVSNYSLFRTQNVLLVDLPDDKKEVPDFTDDDKENMKMDETGNTSQLAGSPLKFEFVTLEKLRTEDSDVINAKMTVRTLTDNDISINPIPVDQAIDIRSKMYESKEAPFDSSVPESTPIFISCNASDVARTVYVGLQRTRTVVRLFATQCTGAIDPPGRSTILNEIAPFDFIREKKSQTRMELEILKLRKIEVVGEEDVVGAHSTLTVDYITKENDIACMPPSTISGVLKCSPGWCDSRMPFYERTQELQFMMMMASALKKGSQMEWELCGNQTKNDSDIQSAVRALIAESGKKLADEGKRFLDFTERLWEILRECRSNELLIKCLQIVLSAVRSSSIKSILHEDNHSELARLVRDSCHSRASHMPRLEGLTPVELLLEIGVERFKRDMFIDYTVSKFVSCEDDLRQLMKDAMRIRTMNEGTKSEEICLSQAVTDTDLLVPFHLGLQTLTHLAEFLQMSSQHALSKATKDVISSYTARPITRFSDVRFEMRVPLVQLRSNLLQDMKPSTFSTECVYSIKTEERLRTHLLLSKTPPLRGLEGVLSQVEETSDRYVATLTKCSTYSYKRNSLITSRPSACV